MFPVNVLLLIVNVVAEAELLNKVNEPAVPDLMLFVTELFDIDNVVEAPVFNIPLNDPVPDNVFVDTTLKFSFTVEAVPETPQVIPVKDAVVAAVNEQF